MKSRVTTVLAASAITVALAPALAACGDDDKEPAGDPTSARASASTPSDEPSPTVTPATGRILENDALSLHLSEGDWIDVNDRSLIKSAVRDAEEGDMSVAIATVPSGDVDLEADAAVVAEGFHASDVPPAKRVENRVINGVECWAFAGDDGRHRTYVVGATRGGFQFSIDIDLESPDVWPESDQRLEEILASVEWKFPTG